MQIDDRIYRVCSTKYMTKKNVDNFVRRLVARYKHSATIALVTMVIQDADSSSSSNWSEMAVRSVDV